MIRVLFLLISIISASEVLMAQKGLTGLWKGVTTNDSITGRKDESFEIALTQYKEKLYGYSRRTFIVNDTLFYAVKRVKGKVNGSEAQVTEDEYISYNFAGRAARGVKVTYYFNLNEEDSTWRLDGRWSTNTVKKHGYYGMTGSVALKEEKDWSKSELFQHLGDLKLDNDVEFYAASKKEAAKKAEPAKAIAKADKPARKDPPAKKENKENPKQEVAKVEKAPVKENKEPVAKAEPPKKDIAVNNNTVAAPSPVVKTTEEKIKERANSAPQVVYFKTDSLVLSLYDNGEVDGDTVSVTLNGVMLMEKQGLRATAIRKSIPVPSGTDEMTLVLFAENLGKYPPNTGLLVVRDGDDIHQVRFSADLTQNATIIFRRKE